MSKNSRKDKSNRMSDKEPKRTRPQVSKSRPSRRKPSRTAPISRLPPEILCEIFTIVKEESYRSISQDYPIRWILLTHVCRHWREVAFDLPSLWASNPWPFNHLTWLQEMLIRSKESPVSIDCHVEHLLMYPESILSLASVLGQPQRVKRLAIEFEPGESDWFKLRKILPQCALQLEHLALIGSPYSFPSPRLKLFGTKDPLHELPKLRYLELQCFDVNWNSFAISLPRMRALSHLKLYRVCRPAWQQFPDILKELLTLESLNMTSSLPAHEGNPHGSNSFYFPSLRNLTVSDDGSIVENFLSYITIPSSTAVNIAVTEELDLDYLPDFLSSLSGSLEGSSQSLFLCQDMDDETLSLTLFLEALDEDKMLADPVFVTPRLILRFCDIPWQYHKTDSMKASDIKINRLIFDSELLKNVSCVYLEYLHLGFSPAALAYTLGELKLLHSIAAKGLAGHILVEAMNFGSYTILDGDSGEPAGTSLYFPNLSLLCFFEAQFRPPNRTARREKSPPLIQQFHKCLDQRQESGAKLEKLTLRSCGRIYDFDISALEAKVGAVDWDDENYRPDHIRGSSSESEDESSDDDKKWPYRRCRGLDDEEDEEE
ncbi:hypothetical protein BDN70DRAFT_877120 [Pholiota conissans]|uniref:F-box domain-containing protein n=1 Tax=Pholiota conissans TaxID=109636 RepID=A0A9P6D1V7_9AGAR|nr:hypothetical protein BDN70DRAFT_877120 [Pholiota conissans]